MFEDFEFRGSLAGARLGPCRVCRDRTVLPAFGDGRCLGCTTDEIDEHEPIVAPALIPREPEQASPRDEIAAIFAEAQLQVSTIKALRGIGATTRFGAGWTRRGQRHWGITTVPQFQAGGLSQRDAATRYAKGLRKAHRAAGICLNCSRAPAPGHTMCVVCIGSSRATYLNRKETGVCVACKGERDGDGLICSSCRRERARRRKATVSAFKAKGICIACFRRPGERVFCRPCAAKRNATRNRRQRKLRAENHRKNA